MQVVQVVWRDTFADAVDWTDPADLATEPRLIRTVGFIVSGGVPGHITLAMSYDQDTGAVGNVLHIPELDVVAHIYSDKS